jgi:hypothetical protein
VPSFRPLAAGLIAGAIALLIGAFVLIYLGAAGLGRRHAAPHTAPDGPTAAPAQPASTKQPTAIP